MGTNAQVLLIQSLGHEPLSRSTALLEHYEYDLVCPFQAISMCVCVRVYVCACVGLMTCCVGLF